MLSSVKTLFISELIGNGFDKNPQGLCAKRESIEVDEVVCRQLWAFTFFFPYSAASPLAVVICGHVFSPVCARICPLHALSALVALAALA